MFYSIENAFHRKAAFIRSVVLLFLRKRIFSFTDLLILSNILIICMIFISYFLFGGNSHLNEGTIILSIFLCAENVLLLIVNHPKRNPFILILMFITTFFYLGRILTLSLNGYSVIMARWPQISFKEVNTTVIFVILSNLFLSFGLLSFSIPFECEKNQSGTDVNYLYNILILLGTMTILSNYIQIPSHFFETTTFLRLYCYLNYFIFNICWIFLVLTLYFLVNLESLKTSAISMFIFLHVIHIMIKSNGGGRGVIFSTFLFFLIPILSIKREILLRRKYIIFIPIIGFLSCYLFLNANRIRTGAEFNNLYQKVATEEYNSITILFSRIGFLDFSVESVANRNLFKKIINPTYYFKSIIDNCLTPGFSIFNTVRLTYALRQFYDSKSEVTSEWINHNYHSDMFTIYGELYVLFGYYALLVFFLVGAMFSRLYALISYSKDCYLYRAFTLYFFYLLLVSFGLDFQFLHFISIVIFIMIITRILVPFSTKTLTTDSA